MKRYVLFFVLVLLLAVSMAFPVYAAEDGGGLWDVVDAVGGFFSDLGKTIMKAIEFLLSGLKKLFIPRDDYFRRLSTRLHEAWQKKFGGVIALANYLKDRFGNLRAYRGQLLVLRFPKNHLFNGAKIDLLAGSGGISDMIRGALSGFVVLCTAAFAYRKTVAMINT